MKRLGYYVSGIFAAVIVCFSTPAYADSGYVAADLLNVRTAPSMNSEVTEILSWGEPLTITYGPTMGWYEIYRNGGCYYVKADYVGGTSSGSDESGSEAYSYGGSYDTSYNYGDTYEYDSSYDSTYDASYSDSSAQQSGEYLGNFVLTAYCSCTKCTSGSGVTASGTAPAAGHTVAMNGVPFGTKLLINGTVYTVEDRGTSYGHVDIYFGSHQEAAAFGTQYADVYQVY